MMEKITLMNCIFQMGDLRSNIGLFYVLQNGLTVYMKLLPLCVVIDACVTKCGN